MLIELGSIGLKLEVNKSGGRIVSQIQREVCPLCGEMDCPDDDALGRIKFNAALDGIESMILAHACAGINVSDVKYITGIQTSLDALSNNF